MVGTHETQPGHRGTSAAVELRNEDTRAQELSDDGNLSEAIVAADAAVARAETLRFRPCGSAITLAGSRPRCSSCTCVVFSKTTTMRPMAGPQSFVA